MVGSHPTDKPPMPKVPPMFTVMPPVPLFAEPPLLPGDSRRTPAGLQASSHATTPTHGPKSRVTRQRMQLRYSDFAFSQGIHAAFALALRCLEPFAGQE